MNINDSILFPTINKVILGLEINTIPAARKLILQPLINFIQAKVNAKEDIRLNFICTHNSRRSHLCQIWAKALSYYFNIKQIYCYSGGTEETAMFHMVTQTLRNTGFQVSQLSLGKNPIISIKYAENEPSIIGFSKKWNDSFNPQNAFVAILTCSQADKGCPHIVGAERRIAIMYEDPKVFDDTPEQAIMYSERSLQIATEFFFIFSQINVEE